MTVGIFFTMAGSWAVACNSLGLETRWHVCTKEFKKPFQLNFPIIPYFDKYPSELEPVDIIVGSPPCIGMSSANRRFKADQKISCVEHAANRITVDFAQTVRNMQPKGFVMEMVSTLLTPKYKPLLDEYMGILKDDYNVAAGIINFVDYNVPQFRKRAIIMGLKKNIHEALIFPEPITPEEKDRQTVGNALKGLPLLTEDEALAQGLTRRFNPAWKGPYSEYLRHPEAMRLKWDQPSRTIAAIHATYFKHPDGKRLITWREAARLMEFPDDFQFEGGFSKCVKLASWGVPCNGITYFIHPVMNAIKVNNLKAKRG